MGWCWGLVFGFQCEGKGGVLGAGWRDGEVWGGGEGAGCVWGR